MDSFFSSSAGWLSVRFTRDTGVVHGQGIIDPMPGGGGGGGGGVEVKAANDKEDAPESEPAGLCEWELETRAHGTMRPDETGTSLKLVRREMG